MLSDITIKQFDDTRWVVSTPEGRNMLVNQSLKELIAILKNSADENAAREVFNETFKFAYSEETFRLFLSEKLGKYGILSNQEYRAPQKKKFAYLNLRVQLLSPRAAAVLSRPFQFLFQPVLFWCLFSVMSIYLVMMFKSHLAEVNFSPANYFLITSLVLTSILFHEIGHTSACAYNKVSHGGIGFGFYFIFPVFYADITNIWQISRGRRTIVNLAGIFNQFIYSSVLVSLFLYYPKAEYFIAAFLIFIKSLAELNPFVRLDGYWILSDVTNTPNLLQKANAIVRETFYGFSIREFLTSKVSGFRFDKQKLLLFVYGVSNWIMIGVFSLYMISHYLPEILNFPYNVGRIMQKTILLDLHWQDFGNRFLLIFTFYILLIRVLLKFTLKMAINRFKMLGLFSYKSQQ